MILSQSLFLDNFYKIDCENKIDYYNYLFVNTNTNPCPNLVKTPTEGDIDIKYIKINKSCYKVLNISENSTNSADNSKSTENK